MSFFSKSKSIDLIYIEGTGDIVEALTRWHNKDDVITETSKTFSGQVFDFCQKNQLNTLAISAFTQKKRVDFEHFSAFSQPKIMLSGGIGYHLSQVIHGIRILGTCIRYRPKYLHITNGATHWFMLAPLKLLGIKVFPQFHNTFWAKGFPPSGKLTKLFLALDAWFLKHIATASICCSPEIKHQINAITQGKSSPSHVFKAQFYRKDFENPLPPPDHNAKPFVIVFAGRVEDNKGVFDILKMADQLKGKDVIFQICGGGSHFDALKAKLAAKKDLTCVVTIHGKLTRPDLLNIYNQGHAVIVPTTSDFCEGLPMVAIEAVLLGRPVITSGLSNALDVLGNAIAEAEPEDIDSYVSAINRLMSDKSFYQEKQAACQLLREQFLDGQEGLTQVLEKTL